MEVHICTGVTDEYLSEHVFAMHNSLISSQKMAYNFRSFDDSWQYGASRFGQRPPIPVTFGQQTGENLDSSSSFTRDLCHDYVR